MAARPVIAVTGPDIRWSPAWWATLLALRLQGAQAVRLTAGNYRQHRSESFEGLVIGGGDDIDPGLYTGQDSGLGNIDPRRDAFEIDMIEHALRTELPILGICRGAQLINVVLGGSLHGDIRALRSHTSNRRTTLPLKTARLEAGTRLHAIVDATKLRINSLHHQAVDRLGAGLRIVAHDLDGFAQAIESSGDQFILGTQWHPEYLPYLARQRRIFDRLVSEARRQPEERLYD